MDEPNPVRLLISFLPKDIIAHLSYDDQQLLDDIADAISRLDTVDRHTGGRIAIARHNSVRVRILTEAEYRIILREQALSKLTAEEQEVLGIQ